MPELPSQLLRVLIIDDHKSFRSAARELLERRGFVVVAEADGAASGVAAAKRLAPHAVLLDVRLPDGNGLDVCHALTRHDPELAVLLVSSDELPGALMQIRECGARGFLLKSRLISSDLVAILGRDGDG